jgi:tRNA(Ile)-lysidine synthase
MPEPNVMHDAFRRNLVHLVTPGDRVLVALSGGADSVALLHLLHGLAPAFSFSLHAAHLDHGMRPESPRDADFVGKLCAELEISLTVERIDIPALAEGRRMGLEETGREARRDFLRRTAAEQGCRVIALGHHRGDQVETFLHRLIRGTALPGLAVMRPKSGPFIRPLLPFSREQILKYLAGRGLTHIEDASNRDLAFTRNRIRHELIPLLQTFNPRVEEHLARLSGRIALEEDYRQGEEDRLLSALGRPGIEEVRLDRAGLAALHPALRARVIRRALERVRGDLRGISAVHIEDVGKMVTGGRSQAEIHLPGAWAACRYESLWLRQAPPPTPEPFAFTISGPGEYSLPDGRRLLVELVEEPQGETPAAVEFDASAVDFPLAVRSFRPGDRFRPAGMKGRKKLKDFFIDARIEKESRRRLPLVEAGEILWVAGVRRCSGRRPAHGKTVLRLAISPSHTSTIRL